MDGISPQDQDLVARTMLAEGGDQGDNGLAAIAHVIRNRALGNDPDFPRDVTGVIHQRNAFTAWNNPRGRNNPNDFRSNDPQLQHARDIAGQVFSGQTPDPTGGATYYADVPLAQKLYGKTPSFSKYPQTAQIGAHTFYNPNPPSNSAPDLASEWAKPAAAAPSSVSPDLASEWTQSVPATFAQRLAGEEQKPSEGGFVQGLAHGATEAVSNIGSRVAQAAQIEMGQPVDVPGPEETFKIAQKEITGPLTAGTGFTGRLGENIGGAIPYMLTTPSSGIGIGSALVQGGLVGVGTTLGQEATRGTSLEPYGGIIGGVAAPSILPSLARLGARGISATAGAFGGLNTGTAPSQLTKSFQSGAEGGVAQQAFRANVGGNVAPEELVNQARGAVDVMGANRQRQYLSDMTALKEQTAPLNFDSIDKAMDKASNVGVFRGQSGTAAPVSIKPKAQDMQNDISDLINYWKTLDPKEYHTPVGMDALKKAIGNLGDKLPWTSEGAGEQKAVATQAYNAVKDAITKQAPQYANYMKDYEDASDQMREITKTLSLKNGASVDTAFRKLLSTTRDNVNTNFGARAALIPQLEQHGATGLSSALAGQALSSWLPRGIARGIAPAEIASMGMAAMLGHPGALAALGLLPLQSPRLMGEAANLAGRASRYLPNINATPLPLRALFSARQKLSNANVPALTQIAQ